MRLIYICHPFGGDPSGNIRRVRRICRAARHDCVPLAPQLLLPAYIDEATERPLALAHCLRLLAVVDEVRVYGESTDGMQLEIAEAERLGIPVVRVAGGGVATKTRDPMPETAGVARGWNDGC